MGHGARGMGHGAWLRDSTRPKVQSSWPGDHIPPAFPHSVSPSFGLSVPRYPPPFARYPLPSPFAPCFIVACSHLPWPRRVDAPMLRCSDAPMLRCSGSWVLPCSSNSAFLTRVEARAEIVFGVEFGFGARIAAKCKCKCQCNSGRKCKCRRKLEVEAQLSRSPSRMVPQFPDPHRHRHRHPPRGVREMACGVRYPVKARLMRSGDGTKSATDGAQHTFRGGREAAKPRGREATGLGKSARGMAWRPIHASWAYSGSDYSLRTRSVLRGICRPTDSERHPGRSADLPDDLGGMREGKIGGEWKRGLRFL
jgi:hypothetical protein